MNQREVDEAIGYILEALEIGVSEGAEEALRAALEFLGHTEDE